MGTRSIQMECTQPDHCVGWWLLPHTTQRVFHRGNKAEGWRKCKGWLGWIHLRWREPESSEFQLNCNRAGTCHIISSEKLLVLTAGHWEQKCKNVLSHFPCSCACHLSGFSKMETKSSTAALQGTQSRIENFGPVLCAEHYFHCTGLSYCFSPNTNLGERPMQRIHIDPRLTRSLGQWLKFTPVLLDRALIQSSWQFSLFYKFIYSIHKPFLLSLAISISEHLML